MLILVLELFALNLKLLHHLEHLLISSLLHGPQLIIIPLLSLTDDRLDVDFRISSIVERQMVVGTFLAHECTVKHYKVSGFGL